MRVFRWMALGLALLLFAGALAFLVWFQWARHTVAGRLQGPRLSLSRQSSPDMKFETLDGHAVHLSDFRGKVVFLDLWGTWCVQCVAEMPTVQNLYDRYRDDPEVVFLIVSRMDTPAQIQRYAARNGLTLPFYRMRDGDIPQTMQLGQFPSTFLYARDGSLVTEHTGAADWAAPAVQLELEQLKGE